MNNPSLTEPGVKSYIQYSLKECKNFKAPAIIIGLGSEVLMYKGIKEVVKKIMNANFLDVIFSTNATLLNEDMSKFLIEAGVTRVVVSLDAAKDETYKIIRSKDELKKVENNVIKLAEEPELTKVEYLTPSHLDQSFSNLSTCLD